MVDTKTLEEYTNAEKDKKKQPPKDNWESFVDGEVLNFFDLHDLEKLTLEDGHGRKAKLARQKNDEISIETSNRRTV